jgi:hypothetical protein
MIQLERLAKMTSGQGVAAKLVIETTQCVVRFR